MKFRFWFIALLMAQILRGSPTPVLVWQDSIPTDVTGYLSYFIDNSHDLTISDIIHNTKQPLWQTYPSNYIQFGYTKNANWLRLDIDFKDIPDEKLYWWFDISPPQNIQFYQIEQDSILKQIQTGINIPFAQRDIHHRFFIFSFLPKKVGKTTIIARFQSDVGSLAGYVYLNKITDFAKHDRRLTSWWLAIFAFLLMTAVLSFGLWGAFKERVYAYYGAYLICVLMLFVSVNGFGYEWFWPNAPTIAMATKIVWTQGMMGFLLVFVYRLLYEVLKPLIWVKTVIRLLTSTLIICIFISLTYFYFPVSLLPSLLKFGNLTLLLAGLFMLFILGIGIYKKYKPAYYFLAAFFPVTLTGLFVLLRNSNVIQHPFLQSSFILIPAFLIEVVLLFFALLTRFQALLKSERDKIQLELESQMRLQHERERISRDLHDNVGAQLSYIISNIDHIVETENKDSNRLNEVADTAKNAILNLRETIWAINNEHITVEDFYDRFKLYANNQVKNRVDIHIVFEENIGHNHLLNPNLALNLYRICQEALNNALKYAQARTIDIFIQTNDSPYFQCRIKDDGIGFDLTENTEGGYGLKNMHIRAHEIGASFKLISEKGKGTLVEITLKK